MPQARGQPANGPLPAREIVFLRQQAFLFTKEIFTYSDLPPYLQRIYTQNGLVLLQEWQWRKLPPIALVELLQAHREVAFVNFWGARVEEMLKGFLERFGRIEAGGALVYTRAGYLLSILRWDLWDLPKGKRERNESLEECARREAQEETGIDLTGVEGQFLMRTRHIFQERNSSKWNVKEVYWYCFAVDQPQPVKPQRSEGIRQVRWISLREWEMRQLPTFLSIRAVLETFRTWWNNQQQQVLTAANPATPTSATSTLPQTEAEAKKQESQ